MDKHVDVENRESRALYGRSYRHVIYADIPPEVVKVMRGPSLARIELEDENSIPFINRNNALRIMLDPSLDRTSKDFLNIMKLAKHSDILEFLSISKERDIQQDVNKVELRKLSSNPKEELWSAAIGEKQVGVSLLGDFQKLQDHFFGDLDDENGRYALLACQTARELKCNIFLTTNDRLIEGRRNVAGWAADLGPMRPNEFSRPAAILFRLSGILPTSQYSTLKGSTYIVTIQELLPSYLPLYRNVSSEGKDEILDYMDGLLDNFVLSLMALDRLASLHYAEGIRPANNSSVGQQLYESESFIIALISALESLTWILFKLSGANGRRQEVTFRRIVFLDQTRLVKPWVTTISEYSASALDAFQSGFVPALSLALHFRDLLQHHMPVPCAVGAFGEVFKVNDQVRFIDKLKIGLLLAEAHSGEELNWPKLAETDGILPGSVIPYVFFNFAFKAALELVEEVLGGVCSTIGIPLRIESNPFFSSPGSDRELTDFLIKQGFR